jgi:hypothetical protein
MASVSPVVDAITRALRGLRYGSVEITVHEGRVTLIERREKVRVKDEEGSGGAGPIGHPNDPRRPGTHQVDEDPTGPPEAPLRERARDATRNPGRGRGTAVDAGTLDGGDPSGLGGRSASPSSSRGRAGA